MKKRIRLRKARIIPAIVCLCGGIYTTYAFYSLSETGDLGSYSVLILLTIAALVAVGVFAFMYKTLKNYTKAFFWGTGVVYLSYLLMLVVISAITGDLAAVLMWLPVIALFGIPYMLPLTVMSWGAVFLCYSEDS